MVQSRPIKVREFQQNVSGHIDVSLSYFATNNFIFWPPEATYQGEGGQKLLFRCAVICKYFFQFFNQHLVQVKPRL